MKATYINIHTHRPTGRGVELRVAGVHPWNGTIEDVERLKRVMKSLQSDEPLVTGEKLFELLLRSDATQDEFDALSLPPQAIGEIGIDRAHLTTPWEQQAKVFAMQLQIAESHNLPVVIHCVRAFDAVMDELRRYQLPAVIFHGFVGSAEQAREAVKSGYYLSFGERTFNSPKTATALGAVPLDRLFLETDDTNITIEEIYAAISVLLEVSVEELQKATTENYERIFETNNG